jgi:hypothetical protein
VAPFSVVSPPSHHLAPAVPMGHLAALHRWLVAAGHVDPASVAPSYLAVLRTMAQPRR